MEFDVNALIGTVGVPGAVCFLMMKMFERRDERQLAAIERNTQALYLIAGHLGVPVPKGENKA